jgi:hypothetical protein
MKKRASITRPQLSSDKSDSAIEYSCGVGQMGTVVHGSSQLKVGQHSCLRSYPLPISHSIA